MVAMANTTSCLMTYPIIKWPVISQINGKMLWSLTDMNHG